MWFKKKKKEEECFSKDWDFLPSWTADWGKVLDNCCQGRTGNVSFLHSCYLLLPDQSPQNSSLKPQLLIIFFKFSELTIWMALLLVLTGINDYIRVTTFPSTSETDAGSQLGYLSSLLHGLLSSLWWQWTSSRHGGLRVPGKREIKVVRPRGAWPISRTGCFCILLVKASHRARPDLSRGVRDFPSLSGKKDKVTTQKGI